MNSDNSMINTQDMDQEEMMFSQDATQRTPKEDTRKKRRGPDNQPSQVSRNNENAESTGTPRKRQRRNSTGMKLVAEEEEDENESREKSWEARERQQAVISEKVEKERRRLEAEEKTTNATNQELYQLYNELQGISHE